MFKKNSWIVALLLALALTALFTGCIDALVQDDVTYTEVELGDFNVWGGQNYQRGWAVAGMKFLGVSDKPEVAADKGYSNEDFAKATKLWIEMKDSSHPSGNLDIIWGGADENGDSIDLDWVQTGGIPFVKDGNTITVDLTAMKDYGKYRNPTIAKRKIILQAGGESEGLKDLVVSAKLLIPSVEAPIPPDLTVIPGGGSYEVPDATAGDYYVDLNNAVIGELTAVSDFFDAEIEETGLTVEFTKNLQTVFIPFDAGLKSVLVDAAKLSYTFDVAIAGTGAYGVRWTLGANRSNNWNTTDPLSAAVFTTQLVNHAVRDDRSADDLNGVVIQARNDNSNPIGTIVVNSIKITPVPPKNAITTAQNIVLADPIAGVPAVTSVSGTGWNGAITWFPTPPNGTFAVSTVYFANIVISMKPNYFLASNGSFKINGSDVVYNPVTKSINSANFPVTDDEVAYIDNGELWTLSEWLDSNSSIGYPLQQAGNPTFTIDSTGIEITNRSAGSYTGVDIILNKIDPRLDPAIYKIKLEVSGNVVGTPGTGMRVNVQGAEGAYDWLATTPESGDGALTTNDQEFELTVDEIPANFLAKGNLRVRICTTGSNTDPFKITEIVVTVIDKR